MTSNNVQKLWKQHWKKQSTIEGSGSFYGKLLHQKRLVILKDLLKRFNPNSSVLDMGCGGGTTISTFKEMNFNNIIGIDFTEESMSRCEKLGLVYGKDVFLMDAKNTKFPDNSFDIVFSEGLWEHFIDPRPHMAEAARLAKKYIIVIQPDHFSFFGYLMHVGWNLFSKNKGGVYEYSFPLSYFKNFLKLYGFELIMSKSTILHEQTVMVFCKNKYTYNINNTKVCMFTNKPYKKLKPYLSNSNSFDLEFHIGQIPPIINKNVVHTKYKHKLSNWEIVLQNFNKKCTTLHFKGDPFFSNHLFFTMIFEPLLQYKHTQNNNLTLHASAISNGNKSYTFSGDANIGKTTVLLHFLSKGYHYLADDQTVINTKNFKVLPYTLPIGVNLKLAIKTNLTLTKKEKLSLFLQTLINTIFLGYTNLTTNISLQNLKFNNKLTTLGTPTKIHKVFILKNSNTLSITKLSKLDAFYELWKSKFGSRSKLPALIYYSEEFKKKNPTFSLWKEYNSLLSKLVEEVPVYQVSFNKKQFQEVIKLIKKEIQSD